MYKRHYSAIMTSTSFPFDEPLVRICKKVEQVGSVALWGNRHEAHIIGGWEQAGPCDEPTGTFPGCQPADPYEPVSFSGSLLPRPRPRSGHLRLGFSLRPRCWYLLVPAPPLTITTDHSPDCYSPEPRPTGLPPDYPSTTPRAPALRHHLERHSMVLR
jgi:hypothetical protein